VRAAAPTDVPAITEAIAELLVELGATPPSLEAMQVATLMLLNPTPGALLVAETGDALIGVLAASWQTAIHIPGRYGLIQDLWVDPAWRSAGVGAELLSAFAELADQLGVTVVEVGLPRERFAQIRATEAFYAANGFESVGPRMRLVLS
jgi:GNAT superfamily N-acetyltransferase